MIRQATEQWVASAGRQRVYVGNRSQRKEDLARQIAEEEGISAGEVRRRSGAVTRKLRLLRAHRVIRKIAHTHRYRLTRKGRAAAAALLLARELVLCYSSIEG